MITESRHSRSRIVWEPPEGVRRTTTAGHDVDRAAVWLPANVSYASSRDR